MLKKMKPFVRWVLSKMSRHDFQTSSMSKRRELFLQWKHGLKSVDANESCEKNEMFIHNRMKMLGPEDWAKMEPGKREYFQQKEEWNKDCLKTWDMVENNTLFY